MKYALKLLLHAEPQALLQNRYITAIISNDFSYKEKNLSTIDECAFEVVIEDFPEGFAYTDEIGTIVWMNKAAKQMLDNITHLDVSNVDSNPKSIIKHSDMSIEVYLSRHQNGFLACFHDSTSQIHIHEMIKEEEKRHERLLKMVIPESVLRIYGMPMANKPISFNSRFAGTVAFQPFIIPNNISPNLNIDNNPLLTVNDVYSFLIGLIYQIKENYSIIDYIDVDLTKIIVIGGLTYRKASQE